MHIHPKTTMQTWTPTDSIIESACHQCNINEKLFTLRNIEHVNPVST